MSIFAEDEAMHLLYFLHRDQRAPSPCYQPGKLFYQHQRHPYKAGEVVLPDASRVVSLRSDVLRIITVSEEGKIYTWRTGRMVKEKYIKPVHFDEPIVDLVAWNFMDYRVHAIAKSGQIYQFSIPQFHSTDPTLTPSASEVRKIILPPDAGDVVSIKCYQSYVAALTSKGKIYRWEETEVEGEGDVFIRSSVDDTQFFTDFIVFTKGTICGITSDGSIVTRRYTFGQCLLENPGLSDNPPSTGVDPSYGVPLSIAYHHVLTSTGAVLYLDSNAEFTHPIHFDNPIVAMQEGRENTLFLDSAGGLFLYNFDKMLFSATLGD